MTLGVKEVTWRPLVMGGALDDNTKMNPRVSVRAHLDNHELERPEDIACFEGRLADC
jgi:hypothetical protein